MEISARQNRRTGGLKWVNGGLVGFLGSLGEPVEQGFWTFVNYLIFF